MTALYADDEILVGHVILEPGEELAEEVHAQQSESIFMLHGSVQVHTRPAGVEKIRDDHRASNHAHVPESVPHRVRNDSVTDRAMYVAFLRRVEDPPQTSTAALTENDFRARVQAGEWPSCVAHGVDGSFYDYDVVVVRWKDDVATYRIGSDNNGWGDNSAMAKANRILALKAHGHDVSPRSP